MNNFQLDLFNKVKEIRGEYRHTENSKEIYGILSVLLHNLAGLIVDIDDEGSSIEDLYPLLLQIAAECQYGCEQIKLTEPQLEQEQQDTLYKKKYEQAHKMLETIYSTIHNSSPYYHIIQKGQSPTRYYEISNDLLHMMKDAI